jgi:hypothetical protein
MVKVTIKITGKATTDTQSRKLGLIFDGTLGGYGFWDTHPEYLVKDPATGADLVIAPTGFTYEADYDLTVGTHTLETAPTVGAGLDWEFEVFINGVSKGKKSPISADVPYTTSFEVTAPPPTLAETISAMMTAMMSLVMLVMLISMLTRVIKGFKPAI